MPAGRGELEAEYRELLQRFNRLSKGMVCNFVSQPHEKDKHARPTRSSGEIISVTARIRMNREFFEGSFSRRLSLAHGPLNLYTNQTRLR
jgi:hypothetical protein